MSHYTPGPWSSEDQSVYASDGTTIADVFGKNRDADANLIAAAPALLKSLEEMLRWDESNICCIAPDDYSCRHKDARAAIAQTKGEK